MGLALKKEISKEGADRKEVQSSLDRVAKQLQDLDGKLKNRYDYEIWKLIQLEQERMNEVEKRIEKLIQYN